MIENNAPAPASQHWRRIRDGAAAAAAPPADHDRDNGSGALPLATGQQADAPASPQALAQGYSQRAMRPPTPAGAAGGGAPRCPLRRPRRHPPGGEVQRRQAVAAAAVGVGAVAQQRYSELCIAGIGRMHQRRPAVVVPDAVFAAEDHCLHPLLWLAGVAGLGRHHARAAGLVHVCAGLVDQPAGSGRLAPACRSEQRCLARADVAAVTGVDGGA